MAGRVRMVTERSLETSKRTAVMGEDGGGLGGGRWRRRRGRRWTKEGLGRGGRRWVRPTGTGGDWGLTGAGLRNRGPGRRLGYAYETDFSQIWSPGRRLGYAYETDFFMPIVLSLLLCVAGCHDLVG